MTYYSIRMIINHIYRIDNEDGNKVIDYGMIFVIDIMLQLGLIANFKINVLE